jgi:hypothetical protein
VARLSLAPCAMPAVCRSRAATASESSLRRTAVLVIMFLTAAWFAWRMVSRVNEAVETLTERARIV